ncbi:hypothetical protein KAW80_04725, partial [Candidatus Babeliales bacterium]|nr:hypothetical protein [Candidatus Babeliales bacterium]
EKVYGIEPNSIFNKYVKPSFAKYLNDPATHNAGDLPEYLDEFVEAIPRGQLGKDLTTIKDNISNYSRAIIDSDDIIRFFADINNIDRILVAILAKRLLVTSKTLKDAMYKAGDSIYNMIVYSMYNIRENMTAFQYDGKNVYNVADDAYDDVKKLYDYMLAKKPKKGKALPQKVIKAIRNYLTKSLRLRPERQALIDSLKRSMKKTVIDVYKLLIDNRLLTKKLVSDEDTAVANQVSLWPPNLQELTIYGGPATEVDINNEYRLIVFKDLPNTITKLNTGSQPIIYPTFPQQLQSLGMAIHPRQKVIKLTDTQLTDCLLSIVDDVTITFPGTLRTLKIYHYAGNVDLSLPNSCQQLMIDGHQPGGKSGVLRINNFGNKLDTLVIDHHKAVLPSFINADSLRVVYLHRFASIKFRKRDDGKVLPPTLEYLYLGGNFNQPLPPLPEGLKHLVLSDNFDQPSIYSRIKRRELSSNDIRRLQQARIFPTSLKTLDLGKSYFGPEPIQDKLPPQLEELYVGPKYNQEGQYDIPTSVKKFHADPGSYLFDITKGISVSPGQPQLIIADALTQTRFLSNFPIPASLHTG